MREKSAHCGREHIKMYGVFCSACCVVNSLYRALNIPQINNVVCDSLADKKDYYESLEGVKSIRQTLFAPVSRNVKTTLNILQVFFLTNNFKKL